MKTRFSLRLILLAVLLASCTPASTTEPPAPVLVQSTATFPPPVPTLDQGQPMPGVMEAPTEAVAPTALPIATSRGSNLEATDPWTVSLESGGLQFVEFFRFT